MNEARIYTPLGEGAEYIRDTSFPHQVARRLVLEHGLKIARFKPKVGKKRQSPIPGLKPQQAELALLAARHEAYILTRTAAFAQTRWGLVFPQELPNDELYRLVATRLTQP